MTHKQTMCLDTSYSRKYTAEIPTNRKKLAPYEHPNTAVNKAICVKGRRGKAPASADQETIKYWSGQAVTTRFLLAEITTQQ